MKKLIFLLAFIPTITFGQLIEKDKQLHLLAGAASGALAYEIAVGENVHPLIPTVGFATFMGLFKETFDELTYGGFDVMDLAFTTLGGLASFAILELIGRDAGAGLFLSFGSGIGLIAIF